MATKIERYNETSAETWTSLCGLYTAKCGPKGWIIYEGEVDVTTAVTSLIEDPILLIVTVGLNPVKFRWGELPSTETVCQHCCTDPCFVFEIMQSIGIHEQIWRSDDNLDEQNIKQDRAILAVLILQSKGLIDDDKLPICVTHYLDAL